MACDVRSVLAIVLLFGGALPTTAPQSPQMVTGLEPGPLRVGFHREWITDPSRVWARGAHLGERTGPVARPLRVDVWYPSDARDCRRMTIRQFLYAQPPDPYFASANAFVQKWDEDSLRGFAKNQNIAFDTMLSPETTACADATVRAGRYPLIVYSGGWYNRSPDNIALAEHLVSFGYVVAEVPLFGVGLWTGDLSSNPVALETQVRDVETVIGTLIQHDWVDRTHVAAMGYSSGGIVALMLGDRHPLVSAVVGLDPSYGEDPNRVLGSSLFQPDVFRVPVLTLRSGHPSYLTRDRSAVLTALRFSDRYTADVGRSTHADFGDDVMLESALSLSATEPRTTSEGLSAYRATISAVRLFLDGCVRNQGGALDALVASADETLRLTKTPAATRSPIEASKAPGRNDR